MFSEVLIGIKNVIQTHLRDVQLKFEDHFESLDFEIRHRDVLIHQLQHRIQELENGHVSPTSTMIAATSGTGNGSTGSSGDIPFVVSEKRFFEEIHFSPLSIDLFYYIHLKFIPFYIARRFVGYDFRFIAAANRW